jgi:predicted chitinase
MLAGLAAELGLSGVGTAIAGAGATALGGLGAAATGIGSTALGLGAGALSLAGGIAATLGGAAVTLLASPVVLGTAALAIGAYGLHHMYKSVKHMWKERHMGPLANVRMAQYGFKADDKDHIDTILDFEASMKEHVTYDASGKPQLDHKKLSFEEALEPFGVKRTDPEALRNWLVWFAQRFRPVFLTHLAALRGINKSVELAEVDGKLKKEEKQQYLKATEFPSGPYRIMATPFTRGGFLFFHWGAKHLECGPKQVEEAIAIARKEVGVDDGKKKDDKKKTGLAAAGATAGAAAVADKGKKDDEPKSFLGKAASVVGKALFATSAIGLVKGAYDSISKFFKDDDLKGLSTMQKIGVFLSPTLHGLLTRSKLHPFEGLRFKAYGLEDYDADKIAALKNIEGHIGTRIKLSGQGENAKAEFVGDPMDVLMHFGASFDPTNVSEKKDSNASKWLEWFTRRFLPVFLTYKGSFLKIAGDRSLLGEPDDNQAAILAPLIASAKGQDGVSVWNIKASPWPGYYLNNDAGTVKAILDLIKDKAKAKKLTDGVDKNKKPSDEGKGWTDLLADKAGKKWDEIKDWMGKKYDQAKNAVAGAWTATKDAVSGTASTAWNSVKNSSVGKTVTGVAQGVGDTMKGFGASLGKAYKATVGNAKVIKDAALAAMAAAGITNPVEMAMFMGQMDTESGGFKSMSENLNYSPATLMKLFGKKLSGGMAQAQQIASQGAEAIGNFIYGNRMGNTAPDDGFKYRGRGIIQLTGKDNYAKYGKMLGLDLVNNPDLASDPKVAAQIAVAYWKTRVPQAAAQAGDVKAVTQAINGGQNGASSREQNFQKYLQQAKAGQLVPSGASSDTKQAQAEQAKNASGAGGTGVTAATPSKNASVLANTLPTGGPNPVVDKATAPAGAPSASSLGAPTKMAGNAVAQNVVDSAAPAQASGWGNTQSAPTPEASPYGFSQASMKSTAPQTRGILAVQQAQHEERMNVMQGHADIAQKSLDVQTETRDLIKQVLAVVQDKQKNDQSGPDNTAGGGANAPRQPNSSLRGTVQQMPRAPVSMTNSV